MPRKSLATFDNLHKEQLLEIVSNEAGDRISESLLVVANRIIDIPEYSCTINIREGEDVSHFMKKWTNKYINGFENRASQRTSNPIGTKYDPILDEIISARINHTKNDLEKIKYGHRLSMSVENIVGAFLEEYLETELKYMGWHCCWGETMKSIDFCNIDGELLQVKNSDNSENSSSKTVRDGTPIKHWFRRFSKNGKTNWKAINYLIGIESQNDQLSEDKFSLFVRDAVRNNPGSIFLEEESPFYNNEELT
jgi:hypothetical protein